MVGVACGVGPWAAAGKEKEAAGLSHKRRKSEALNLLYW